MTADIDLILDFEPENLRRAVGALGSLGYRPRAPVAFEDFIDSDKRSAWTREKGLTVFSLYSPDHAATEIDLFVEAPREPLAIASPQVRSAKIKSAQVGRRCPSKLTLPF